VHNSFIAKYANGSIMTSSKFTVCCLVQNGKSVFILHTHTHTYTRIQRIFLFRLSLVFRSFLCFVANRSQVCTAIMIATRPQCHKTLLSILPSPIMQHFSLRPFTCLLRSFNVFRKFFAFCLAAAVFCLAATVDSDAEGDVARCSAFVF